MSVSNIHNIVCAFRKFTTSRFIVLSLSVLKCFTSFQFCFNLQHLIVHVLEFIFSTFFHIISNSFWNICHILITTTPACLSLCSLSPMAGLLVFSRLPLAAVPPPPELPPAVWWGPQDDQSLLVGAYKHGYENYALMRADSCLSFLATCGPPTKAELEAQGGTVNTKRKQ
jgi:hypothetical protein